MRMGNKILILCDKSSTTSFGRISESFLRALHGGHDAHILWLRCPKDFPHGHVTSHGHTGHSVWSPSRESGLFGFPLQVARKVRKLRPDWILLIRPELGFLVPTLRKAAPQAKLSLMIHDTFAETLYPRSLKFRLINRFWIKGCDRVDGFLFNSDYTRSEASKVFNLHGPQTLCGCVIDSHDFHPLPDRDKLRQQWGFATNVPIVLNISLDEPRKNIAVFLRLARRFPNCRFVRIGKLSERIRKIQEDENIQNVEHRQGLSLSALREFYNMADVLVFPSLLEGFGYPPLEALACGTPVIASNTSAMRETLPGIAELVDDPHNLDSWESALRKLLNSERTLDPEVEKRLKHFGPEAFAQRVKQHLRDLKIIE